MSKYEINDSNSEHAITGENHLCCADTGRVIAVFYNDYDLNDVIAMDAENKQLKAKLKVAESLIDFELTTELEARYEELESK